MTDKECIETLKIALTEVEWNYPMDYSIAIEQAIEAVKYKEQHEISESVNEKLDDSVRFELENSRAWFEKSVELSHKLTVKENHTYKCVCRIEKEIKLARENKDERYALGCETSLSFIKEELGIDNEVD